MGGGANTTQVDSELAACQAQVNELQALVKFYEKKLNTLASEHVIPAQEGIPGGRCGWAATMAAFVGVKLCHVATCAVVHHPSAFSVGLHAATSSSSWLHPMMMVVS